MSITLKPCPFCGQVPELVATNTDIGGGDFCKVFLIWCKTKNCIIIRVTELGESGYKQGDTQTNEQAEQKVITRWNTRSN